MNFSTTVSAVFGDPTAISDSPFDTGLFNTTYPEIVNGTTGQPVFLDDGEVEGNYIFNTFLGLLIVLVASMLNAFGLNLTKLDHIRQQAVPKRERKKEYMRVLWLVGMGTYIASQVFGSPLALRFLRPDWVAPLGSSSLIFNFIFAYWMVGTPVTPTDIRGTAVIVFGVILILIFSSINHGLQQSLSISRLNSLWARPAWIAYFILVSLFTISTYLVSSLFAAVLASRASYSPLPSPTLELPTSRPTSPPRLLAIFGGILSIRRKFEHSAVLRLEKFFSRTGDARIVWLQGIGWAVAGGSLAGLCLVFTKAVVKIYWLPGHPLVHVSSMASLSLVVVTAVAQIICLNRALQCADTVVVVPLFYAGYTVLGFVNSLIFYNESGQYARWVLIAVFISIAILISGVVLLSLKSSVKTATDPYTVTTEPTSSMRLNPRTRGSRNVSGDTNPFKGGDDETADEDADRPKEDVLWEVGSLSDTSDNEEDKRKGIGGGSSGGERRGLLYDDEGEEVDESVQKTSAKGDGNGQDDEVYGEYEGVQSEEQKRDQAMS
ncbi:hypothetical protein TREMEDRAFT_43986 [Tremella mesenterica DSM 1558]|uniref:uncharacterized protein n=1 Tax=Tremella mesenterica (strain ATCC 24925 / CBS 8224 / DSM 1558 / NBRC 9311 / NRRL Y-6157 / RJB 2259-6 / UBC 559-6) TaxID=578456 RepID=UPI0003F4A5E5|nr:uncharacterized protein TREMEDRAFT_43986 [Tremella mesenterica DSM 1558]EIW69442.1 hypothetical protein TREMEDRAFT_43986 [Tremella mesenterica DSM 1558]